VRSTILYSYAHIYKYSVIPRVNFCEVFGTNDRTWNTKQLIEFGGDLNSMQSDKIVLMSLTL